MPSAERLIEIQTLIRDARQRQGGRDNPGVVRSARPGQGNAATDKNVARGPGPARRPGG